jgi:AcrR family transcriptional regulator
MRYYSCVPRIAAGRKTPLTPDEIIDAALAIADVEGLDALTTSRLAARVGVTQMALYRHFANKGEIVQAALDRVWEDALTLDHVPSDPIEILVEASLSVWRAFLAHPSMAGLVGAVPEPTPELADRTNNIALLLQLVGFPPDQVANAYTSIATYTLGAVLLIGSRFESMITLDRDPESARKHVRESIQAQDPTAGILGAIVPSSEEAEADFELGLRALLQGLIAGISSSAAP